MMTIGELIDELQYYSDDTPVIIAIQPSYPIALKVSHVVEVDGVVFIAAKDEHPENPYPPKEVYDDA